MIETAKTETEMRDRDVPTPTSVEELSAYINSLVNREHEYGTCVYAMSMAATAAFNYVAHCLCVSGFQASCADLDILRRTRRMEQGFMIFDYNDLLYPQNLENLPTVEKLIKDNKDICLEKRPKNY